MKKINFKQGKYIFPLVILLPLLFLGHTLIGMFSGDDDTDTYHEGLQTQLPEAQTKEVGDKYTAMYNRFNLDDNDAYTAVTGVGIDEEHRDTIESAYTEEEKARLLAEQAQRDEQAKALADLQRQIDSHRNSNSYTSPGASAEYNRDSYRNEEDEQMGEYATQIKSMQAAQIERQKMLARALGLKDEDDEKPVSADTVKPVKPEPPQLVLRSRDANSDRFNTIGSASGKADETLIRAMIDRTTKAHQGTRLRFKLLDDVTISDVQLKKGTYLYGTVTGFGQQRVMAGITSIMVGNRFLKVDLSVFDNDGMEGFYVPESAFRDFMKNAASGVTQQSINFNSGNSYGNEVSGEQLALQALQNVYNSASQAISANIRKNRAKIKYNTIVYLINSREAQ